MTETRFSRESFETLQCVLPVSLQTPIFVAGHGS